MVGGWREEREGARVSERARCVYEQAATRLMRAVDVRGGLLFLLCVCVLARSG